MHSRTIVLIIGVLAAPLSLQVAPQTSASGTGNLWLTAGTEDSVNGHVLTPAPVSNLDPDGVSAVDRAAQPGSHTLDAGPTNSTPFSSTPSGTLSEGGDQGSQRDRSLSPADQSGVTPNLGR